MREGIDVRGARWVSTELLLPSEFDDSAPYPGGIGGIGGGSDGRGACRRYRCGAVDCGRGGAICVWSVQYGLLGVS
jgi:hypothetical protein